MSEAAHVVHIPGALRSYTGEVPRVEARGANLDALLDDLNRRYPGFRFRIVDETGKVRPHMRIFVGGVECEDLRAALGSGSEVHVLCALSGG